MRKKPDNAEDRQLERDIEEMVAVFTDAFIVWPGWPEVPQSLREQIILQRLVMLMSPERTATDAEAALYLMTTSLCQPLSAEWVRIYLYCCTRTLGNILPEDLRHEELAIYEKHQLDRLKHFIYNSRLKRRRERKAAERTAERAQPRITMEVEPEPGQQMNLFEEIKSIEKEAAILGKPVA